MESCHGGSMESCHGGFMEPCDGYDMLAGALGLLMVAEWSLVMVLKGVLSWWLDETLRRIRISRWGARVGHGGPMESCHGGSMQPCHGGFMEFCNEYDNLAGALGLVMVAQWSLAMVARCSLVKVA